jgi:Flp pilus assembly protein TadG
MKRLLKNERGVTAIEFGILGPVLCAFLVGIVDAGYALYTQQALYHGAILAARCGALNTASCSTASQIKTAAASNSLGLSPPASTFTVSDATCGKLVTASYPYRPFATLSSNFTVTLTARGCFLNYT